MIRNILLLTVAVAMIAALDRTCHAVVVVGEDFFYQQESRTDTSFGDVRFARQNYGGGQDGPGGVWNQQWVGSGSGSIISDDTTQEPYMSHPFTARFTGENSENNNITRNYEFDASVEPQQTIYFGGQFFATSVEDEQSMFVEMGVLTPSTDGLRTLASIGLTEDTFFAKAGWVDLTGVDNLGGQMTLGDAGMGNDFTDDETFHLLVGKLELNVAPNTLADYNGDGFNNAADYVAWRNNNGIDDGSATFEQGDGNGDGNVDNDDYVLWARNAYSMLDRVTAYIDPTGVETSNGSTLVAEGEIARSLDAPNVVPEMFLTGGFSMGREMFADDVVIGTTWDDVMSLNVPRLDLEVNTSNGDVALVNNTSVDIDLAFYEVLSDSDSLDSDGWNSLDEQGTEGDTWQENSPTDGRLTESNLTSATTLAASGGSLPLGAAYDTAGTPDLLARWGTKQGAVGLLNLANVSYTGAIGSSAVIPEPSSLVLLLTAGLLVAVRRRA